MKLTATKPEKEKEQGMKPYHHQATAKVVYDLLIGWSSPLFHIHGEAGHLAQWAGHFGLHTIPTGRIAASDFIGSPKKS